MIAYNIQKHSLTQADHVWREPQDAQQYEIILPDLPVVFILEEEERRI